MRIRTVIVVAVLLVVLTGWAVVAQQSKPAVPPRELTNSIGMKFVLIDPGSFKMGSESGGSDEKPIHEVALTKGFYMQATEVTQAQWQAVMGSNPSLLKGQDLPVDTVSWDDVQEFLGSLPPRRRALSTGCLRRRSGSMPAGRAGRSRTQLPTWTRWLGRGGTPEGRRIR